MQRAAALGLAAAILLAGCLTAAAPLTSEPSDHPMHPEHPEHPPHAGGHATPPSIGHVFVVVLENEDYDTTFPAADPPSPYLAQDLVGAGRFLTQYHGIGHASLDNYIAMVSGQAPNPVTQGDCFAYLDFHRAATVDGQAVGQGCVYPADVLTIGDQLDAAGHTWRQYAEDMANVPGQAPTACRHQALNSQDTWQGSTDAADQYATRHVPFVYFHSVIDGQARCDDRVVDLRLLEADLQSVATTREFNLITPDVCSDGHDAKCANPAQRSGYGGIDGFLRVWIPRIQASPAYQEDGLIVVAFDEAEAGSPQACCNETAGYNTPMPGISGPGGGRTGAVLLSACFAPGSVDGTPYNHYSLLRTMEDVFHLGHLGYAAQDGLAPIALGAC